MIYSGEFKDINNRLYKVEITTNGGGTKQDVTLGGTPFVTAMSGDSETIYSPAKYQSATIGIITPDYNFDIYSARAQGTKVVLYNQANAIEWVGYVTPNLYDMGFTKAREEVEIECIDALSTLQYIKYESEDKRITNFLEIIKKLLKSCNAYSSFYFTSNIQLTKDGTDTILDKLFVSEQNFFDKKEDKETDEDVAWTMQEVLEELCRYLGVTCFADGDRVYFVDYDAIKHNHNSYYKYSLLTDSEPTLESLSYMKLINADAYSGSDSSLSLDNVYNKVVIEDDIYNIDTIIPDLTSLENQSKANFADDSSLTDNRYKYKEEQRGIEVFTINTKQYGQDVMDICLIQYFNIKENDNIKLYSYEPDDGVFTGDVLNQYYTFTPNLTTKQVNNWNRVESGKSVGICGIKYYYKDCTDRKDGESIEDYLNREYENITKLDLSDALLVAIPDNQNDNPPQSTYPGGRFDINKQINKEYKDKQPIFTIKSELLSINKDTNIVLNGGFTFFRDRIYLPYAEKYSDKWNGLGEGNIYFSFKFGDYYYTGDKSKGKRGWVKEFAVAPIPLDTPTGENAKKKFGDEFKIKDVTNWKDRTTDKEGFVINFPLEGNETMTEQIEITFYRPFGVDEGYPARYCLIKGLEVDIVVNEDIYNLDADADSNTVYTNIINDKFVTELSDIQFKVCTWDNKKPNYSSVVVKNGADTYYLDKTFNKANYAGEQAWTSSEGTNSSNGLRQEEHLIYKLVNQYSTPSVILNLPLRNEYKLYGLYLNKTISNKQFIIDTMGVDYKANSAEIKLVEKK